MAPTWRSFGPRELENWHSVCRILARQDCCLPTGSNCGTGTKQHVIAEEAHETDSDCKHTTTVSGNGYALADDVHEAATGNTAAQLQLGALQY